MTTTNMDFVITKDDKKILKNADSIVFLYRAGNSRIKCNKTVEVKGYKTDVTESIHVESRTLAYNENEQIREVIEGSYTINFAKSDLEWQSILKNIKVNDKIILEWVAGNSNNIMKKHNLVEDVLYMKIKRNDKVELSFNIGNLITERNSIARMIQTVMVL